MIAPPASARWPSRRDFLAQMPEDALADDVHVACRAMLAGQRIGHAAGASVVELRSPRTLRALVRHKYRKADAYLREIVRVLPDVCRIPPPMRAIFLWRAALLTIVPLLGLAGSLAAAISVPFEAIIRVAFITMLLLVMPPLRAAARVCALAALLAAVSAAAFLMLPFSRQQASFPKILRPSEY